MKNKIKSIGKKFKKGSKATPVSRGSSLAHLPSEGQLSEGLKEHREEALKRGKKHRRAIKKPKHRVMFLTLLLVGVLIGSYFVYGYVVLERRQSYSDLAYNLSKTLPYNASRVDGEEVSYEEYLFILKENLHYLIDFDGPGAEKIDVNTEDGDKIVEEQKAQAIERAEEGAFIRKKARELNLSVSDQEVDQSIAEILSRRDGFSQAELEKALKAHYNWTMDQYRRLHKGVLLSRKVLAKLDEEASNRMAKAKADLNSGADFNEVAKSFINPENSEDSFGGYIGIVNVKTNSADLSGPALSTLKNLGDGKSSDVIISNDSLIIVQNIRTVSDDEREVSIISLKFKPASKYLEELRSAGKVERYLKLK